MERKLRKKRWVWIGTVAGALLLVAGGYWNMRPDPAIAAMNRHAGASIPLATRSAFSYLVSFEAGGIGPQMVDIIIWTDDPGFQFDPTKLPRLYRLDNLDAPERSQMKRHELNAVIDIRQVSPAAMAQLRSCVIDSELFETPTPPLRVADGFVSHLIWIEHNNPYESSVESTLSDSALYTIHRQILAQAYLLSTVAK